MQGKAVVITGGTSGIGEVAAEALAKMGARIILVARNTSRGNATLVRLRRSAPGVQHSVYFADLTRLAEMKRVAAEIADKEPPIDVLINNAGALFAKRRVRGRHAYGLQFHLEVSQDMARQWLEVPEYAAALRDVLGPGAEATLIDEFAKFEGPLRKLGRVLFERWLDLFAGEVQQSGRQAATTTH
jgi:NAD(P)-dependent dehydrogenase (short-subunit alcohol dehydrogenase family)